MKTQIKQLVAGLLLLIGVQQASAQLVVSQYNNERKISAPNSVTLVNGFHATGNVRIFTTGISYRNCLPQVSNPSNDQNYILTRTFRDSGVNVLNISTIRGICEENQTIQYFDGLGRPLQTVQVNGSLAGHDLVQPFAYDAFGREDKKYQPYSVWNNNGVYRADAIIGGGQAGYYASPPSGIKATATPFSQTIFEASPLNRVLEQGGPGDDWQPIANSNVGHTMKIEYGTNIEGEVRLWTIKQNGAFTDVKYYNPGKLYKTTTKDENWTSGNAGTTDEFKDFEGRVVLKRVWETDVKSLKTCYLYDDFGNLRYVMPPAVTAGTDRLYGEITSFDESQVEFLDYMYGYHYDSRNRVIEKKIPGKGWEEMIYNPLDQVVFTQDSIQRQQSERAYVKYDVIGRVIMTGVETGHSRARQSIQDEVNNYQGVYYDSRSTSNANGHGYDYASTPAYWPNMRVDVVNYYDNYENIPDLPNNESANYSKMIKGLLVAQKVRVLGTDVFLWTVNYYDDEGRVVRTHKQHYLSGSYNVANYDDITNSYSFVGELISSTRIHHANGVATTIADRYEYDHVGRPIATFQKINDQTEVALAHQIYNELGQLKEKKLNNDKHSTSLAYNERGWMTGSSSNEFSINLKYNDGTVPQFNGNIANQVYNNGGIGNTFTYNYDKLNRLTKGEVSPTLMSEVITYDVMGNITSLNRDNVSPRTYHYNGNKLYFAEYVTNGYVYDANGNATTDGRNGMVLSYNYLNLPTTANNASMSLSYTYDATGRRLKKIANGAVRNYIDGIEYNPDGAIDFIKTEAGIARKSGSTYTYEYNLTDHLGNVRYSFNQDGAKLQQDDYYAFGIKRNTFASGVKNKYLYNGKEVQEELGEEYDYGARFYDPVIARWNVVDPLAEKFISANPYNYTDNNPVNNIDPNGMETYYGQEAQDWFRQMQGQMAQGGSDGPEDPKKKKKPGYFSSFYNSLSKGNPFGNTGQTWENWLSSESTLGKDLWNTTANSFWGIASLLDGNTYVNLYKGQKEYWSSSSEERAKADAEYINNFVEGTATFAPFGYVSTNASVIQTATKTKQFLSFEANGGYGVQLGNFELMYRNPRADGGTILSYKSSVGNKFRVDYHRISGSKRILHYHTNYYNLPEGTHRSFNLTNFGKAVKL